MIEQEQAFEAEGADEFDPQDDAVVDEQSPAEQEAQEAPAPRTIEDIAANMGWTPRESWRGDPDKWKPADQFVEHTAQVNSRLVTKLKSVEDQISNINRVNQTIMERELAKQREELLAARQEAFDVGDAAKFDEVNRKLGEMPNAPVAPQPEVQGFIQKHASWWGKDQEATAWAVSRAGELAAKGIGPARQLQIVERELGQLFPEYAPQEKPKPKAVSLSQPGSRTSTSRAKGFSDLPKEAQDAAIDFEKRGRCSRDEYAREYFAGQG